MRPPLAAQHRRGMACPFATTRISTRTRVPDSDASSPQAILFAVILLLIPVGLFTFNWPVWLLATLLVFDLILLFFVSMTSVFLLRVFFADRRRGTGRQTGVAKPQTRVISTEEEPDDE